MHEDWAKKYELSEHESDFWEKHWILSLLIALPLVLLIWTIPIAAVVLLVVSVLGWEMLAVLAFFASVYFFFWLLAYGALRILSDICQVLRG